MKKSLFPVIIFISLFFQSTGQYTHQNIFLLGRFDDSTVVAEPTYGIRYQSCWGWADQISGREYGIIGSTGGTYIVEVTNPSSPVVRQYIPGRSNNRIWHEYKTYGNYLYIIADGGGNSLQIADLSYLPDSVHLIYDDVTIFDSGHTLFVDGNHLYVANVTQTNSLYSSMNVYSLSPGPVPVLLRRLDSDYPAISQVHDMFVMHDTVFASCGNDGLYIFKYNAAQNRFTQLGSLTSYPDAGYNHSSCISEDHTILYMCDEVPDGMAVKVVDMTNLLSPAVVDTFYAHPGSTPHNPYVKGNTLFMAYYQDGVISYDISNPGSPVQNGFFDTHPQNPSGTYPYPPYAGCWAVYPFLPSGLLLASDMQRGLFLLDASQIDGIHEADTGPGNLHVYPNPATSVLQVSWPGGIQGNIHIELLDPAGKMATSKTVTDNSVRNCLMDVSNFEDGIYFLRISDEEKTASRIVSISH